MALELYQIAIDAADPKSLGRFWAAALDQRILYEDDEQVIVGVDDQTYPGLCFLPVPEGKVAKNRLHLDLRPGHRDTEVDRLIGLGATRADVGQGDDVTWVVLADPEGNEFCVLTPHATLID